MPGTSIDLDTEFDMARIETASILLAGFLDRLEEVIDPFTGKDRKQVLGDSVLSPILRRLNKPLREIVG